MKIQFLVEENTFRFDRTRKFEFSKILSRGNRSKFIIRIILLNISDDKIRQRWKLISVRENVNLENKVSRIARISGLRHSSRRVWNSRENIQFTGILSKRLAPPNDWLIVGRRFPWHKLLPSNRYHYFPILPPTACLCIKFELSCAPKGRGGSTCVAASPIKLSASEVMGNEINSAPKFLPLEVSA